MKQNCNQKKLLWLLTGPYNKISVKFKIKPVVRNTYNINHMQIYSISKIHFELQLV